MIYKNGYKVVYEVAADGKRTFYATKSNVYPPRDEAGNIIENEMNILLASFDDVEFAGKIIYEYKGEFFVSTGAVPAYNEDGTPADKKIAGFEPLFVEGAEAAEAEEPVTEPVDDEPTAEPEVEDEVVDGDDETVVAEDETTEEE